MLRDGSNRRQFSLFLALALGLGIGGTAAAHRPSDDPGFKVIHGEPPLQAGGGELTAPARDQLSDEMQAAIWAELNANIDRLRAEGKLFATESPLGAHPTFNWPLRAAAGLTDLGYWGISNFVDQDPGFPGLLLDYECGARTYDLSDGYNHAGIDYFLWPFAWYRMSNDQVEVVAAATGQIVFKDDGHFDLSCGFNNDPWNAVYLEHADGSFAAYGHLKSGSVTAELLGAVVTQGDYLGVVGSSGSSTGPHLHLEVYDSAGQLNEPYDGPCNNMNPGDSWWAAQRPYDDSAVNRMQTGSAAAIPFPPCPQQETPNDATSFSPGELIYFTTFYRDQLSSQTSMYRLFRPNGSLHVMWSHSSSPFSYSASWWYWTYNNLTTPGLWRFEVQFDGGTYSHFFAIGPVPDSGETVDLTVERLGAAQARLSWSGSCLASDVDFEVYEGTLGNWYDHGSIACSTGGATQHDVTIAAGNSYYLVVPTNTIVEGGYGTDSALSPRPQGAPFCFVQSTGVCP